MHWRSSFCEFIILFASTCDDLLYVVIVFNAVLYLYLGVSLEGKETETMPTYHT